MGTRQPKNLKINHLSDFYCTKCGHKGIPIIRRSGKLREPGHLKKLYCLYCNSDQNMVEIVSNGKYTLEDFRVEYEHNNFKDGERLKPFNQFISELRQKGLI